MSFIVQTNLYNFKSNEIIKGPVTVEWYKYSENEKPLDRFSFLNGIELSLFLRYIKSNKHNFPGSPVILTREESNSPIVDPYKRALVEETLFSPYILLGSNLLNAEVRLPFWICSIVLVHPDGRVIVNDDLSFALMGLLL
jgi:hypothetical protein